MKGARSSVPIDPLQKIFLSWNVYTDTMDDRQQESRLENLPWKKPSYSSYEDYHDTLLPLFLTELRAQFHRDCAWKDPKHEAISESFSFRSFDISKCQEFVVLHLDRRTPHELGPVEYCGGQVVILHKDENVKEAQPCHCYAHVDNFSFNSLSLRIRVTGANDTLGPMEGQDFQERSRLVAEAIGAKSDWYVTSVGLLSTAIREYKALKALKTNTQILKFILNQNPHEASRLGRQRQALKVPRRLQVSLQQIFNASQLRALQQSCRVEGITLIQGPPGTGKTTTIQGVLSVILNSEVVSTDEAFKESLTSTSVALDSSAPLPEDEPMSPLSTSSGGDFDPVFDREATLGKGEERDTLMLKSCPWLGKDPQSIRPWYDLVPLSFLGYPAHPGGLLPTQTALVYPRDEPLKLYDARPWIEKLEDLQLKKRRVLVCAPSNAAIDEIIRRLLEKGCFGGDGLLYTPSIVRVGPGLHPSLKKHSLEAQAAERIARAREGGKELGDTAAKSQVLDAAQIVCSTLSVAGSKDILDFHGHFDTVVIDEASQGVEISTLIPLQLGCRRLVLVGDPKQLPATVFSKQVEDKGYSVSLFQRLQDSGFEVTQLSTQFRMNPLISRFPSLHFYSETLKDDPSLLSRPPPPWSAIPHFGPVAFYNVESEESREEASFVNVAEAKVVLNIIRTLMVYYPDQKWHERLAVISPYAKQAQLLKRLLKAALGKDNLIDVGTVDGFQGREKDVILVSTVRAHQKKNSIGFLQDTRRMNVALTRAKHNLWVVGNARMLKINEHWGGFVEMQEEGGRRIDLPDSPLADGVIRKAVKSFFQNLPRDSPLLQLRPPGASELQDGALHADTGDEAYSFEGLTLNVTEEDILKMKEELDLRRKAKELDRKGGGEDEEVVQSGEEAGEELKTPAKEDEPEVEVEAELVIDSKYTKMKDDYAMSNEEEEDG